MRNLFLLAATVLMVALGSVPLWGQMASYDDVMLIVNDSSSTSAEIGSYFATRRGIPSSRICHIKADTSESMDSAAFMRLKWQIEGWMRDGDLTDSINYIVTTKGCPLRIRTAQRDDVGSGILGGLASFEDCLALMNGSDSVVMLSTRTQFAVSRYFGSEAHFRRDPVELPMYLVTRLDGYTVDDIKSYIRKAEDPAAVGDGTWVLDIDPGRDGNPGYKIGNDWLRGAKTALEAREMNVILNLDNVYLHDQKNVIGYASWGSNDGNSGGGLAAKPGNTWLNGSIAETFVSTSGRSFAPGTGYGQSLIADWIAEGASGVKGYTDEPYLTSIAHPDIVFDRYAAGFNMAESFYAGSQFIAWRQVVIGDPKMRLATLLAVSEEEIDFGTIDRYAMMADTVWVRNTRNVPVQLENMTMDGNDLSEFRAVRLGGGSLPVTLPPGDSLGIVVSAQPTFYGEITAQLLLRYQRSGDTRSFSSQVRLAADVQHPPVQMPDTVYFDAAGSGEMVEGMVELQNLSASDTLKVTSLTLSGTGAGRFVIGPSVTVPLSIPPGIIQQVPVRYTASAAGDDRATLAVRSNALQANRLIRLVGRTQSSSVPALATAGEAFSVLPNPFGARAEIRYVISDARSAVRMDMLDVLGKTVVTVDDGMRDAGEHVLVFDGSVLPDGMYICRLTFTTPAGTRTVVRSLLHER